MNADPREILARGPMRGLQILVVALCFALNALDGFDVLAISFASPGIAAEWGIDRAVLGIVLSMELIGMAAGSVLIGQVADRIGRRPTILGCLVLMSVGMFLAAVADGVTALSVTRLVTGLGIGGMLAATSALVAEFSTDESRGFNVMLNIAGYATGAIIGGTVASLLLAQTGDWRSVFIFGGSVTALLLPITWRYLPESIDLLITRGNAGALEQVNSTLRRLEIAPLDALPAPSVRVRGTSFAALFSPQYAPLTILLTCAYFAQVMTFYYVVKWIPKIVVDLGFDAASAGGVLVWANVGGLLGAISLGLVSRRLPLRPWLIASMVTGFVMLAVFGIGHDELTTLSVLAGIIGFFVNAGVVGMYPIFAQTFPAAIRASGTGFAIGMGRGGSAVGPVLAGALFAKGSSLLVVSLIMGSGALVAALMIVLLPWAGQLGRRARE
jgi:benzoate transport